MNKFLFSLLLFACSPVFSQNIFDGYASQEPLTRLEAPYGVESVVLETAGGEIPQSIRIAFTQSVVVRNSLGNGMGAKGSGTYLGDGIYSSAWHVVRDNPNGEIAVEWKDGKKYAARVLGKDPIFDIVLLETEAKPKGGVPLAKANINFGDTVFLAGYSQGPLQAWRGRMVATGSPSGQYPADWTYSTGGAISGDSGGPVLDASGYYVGPLWGSDGSRTCFTNTGRFQRFLLPWNARLAAWHSQKQGCYGGVCPPQGPSQGSPYGGDSGRVPVEENPGTPITPPPGNIGWPENHPDKPSGCDCDKPKEPKGCDCEKPRDKEPEESPSDSVNLDDLAEKIASKLKDDPSFKGPAGETGPEGPQGPQGPEGPPGKDAEITDEMLATIAAAVYQKMRNDPAFKGPPGKDGAGVGPGELERIKAEVLASLPDLRVLLIDGSNGSVIDDETYAPGEPLVLDFQRVINAARQR